MTMSLFSRKTTEDHWRDGIDSLRDRADGAERTAKTLGWLGADKTAAKAREQAELDRRLADQEEQCLRSGRYLRGERQHPTVEEQRDRGWW